MPRKAGTTVGSEQGSTLAPTDAARLLSIQREKGRLLLASRPIREASEKTWETVTREVLVRAFGPSSPNVSSVMDVGEWAFPFGGGDEQEWEAQRAQDMTTRLEIIDGLVELLNTTSEMGERSGPGPRQTADEPARLGGRVFLVHGHNEAVLHRVARFVEGLELAVTILREEPSSGRTIIEKFVDCSDVSFAIVLLTGDDRGGDIEAPYEDQTPRPRQNVILELGFFLGKLG